MVANPRWSKLDFDDIFRSDFLREYVIDLNFRRPTWKCEFGSQGVPIDSANHRAPAQIQVSHDDDLVLISNGKLFRPSFVFEQLQIVEKGHERQVGVDD